MRIYIQELHFNLLTAFYPDLHFTMYENVRNEFVTQAPSRSEDILVRDALC